MKDAIDKAETKAEKDSIRNYSQDRTVIKSVSFNNVRVNIKSKNPMPYDPANFTLGYSYSINDKKNPETEYETTKDYRPISPIAMCLMSSRSNHSISY